MTDQRSKPLTPLHAAGERSIVIGDGVRQSTITTGDVHVHQAGRQATPFQVPPLPPHFVPRPQPLSHLKTELLSVDDTRPGVLAISAIHGLGGIGKSVLAAAVAHDEDVRTRYPDGVLWVTLGQQPDLVPLLSGWIQALGDHSFQPTGVEAAAGHLRSLLRDLATLLIIDDAWHTEDVRPLLAATHRSNTVVTTRRADVVDEIGAYLCELDVMSPSESLKLLSARVGRDLQGSEQRSALDVAEAVGYLPLALNLVAARVRRGGTWSDLLCSLNREVADLSALEPPRARRRGLQLEATLTTSLTALRSEYPQAWQAFIWLGVLPADAPITPTMAATLWDTSTAEASALLELLWGDALLIRRGTDRLGERERPVYLIHDLLHDVALRRVTQAPPQGLGLDLADAHSQLLARYGLGSAVSAWATLPNDGYIHTRLVWHIARSRTPEWAHALLRATTDDGRNAWYEARERLGQTAGYLNDLALARTVTKPRLPDSGRDPAQGIAYGLIEATLSSLAANIPPSLLVSLVEKGIWSAAQGLAYARRIADGIQRAKALVALSSGLGQEARGVVQREALAALADGGHVRQQADALLTMASELSSDVVSDAADLAHGYQPRWVGVWTLAGIAPYLGEPARADLVEAILDEVLRLRPEHAGASSISSLARFLTLDGLEAALGAALQLTDPYARVVALVGLAPVFSHDEEREQRIWTDALNAGLDIDSPHRRSESLYLVATGLARRCYLRPALYVADKISSSYWRALALAELLPHLPGSLRSSGVAVAPETIAAIQSEPQRFQSILALVPGIAGGASVDDTLRLLNSFDKAYWRARATASMAPFVPESHRTELLQSCIASTVTLRDKHQREDVFKALAPMLSPMHLREVVRALRRIGDRRELDRALAALAAFVGKDGTPADAERRLASIEDRKLWVGALHTVCADLAERGYAAEALTMAEQLGRGIGWARLVSSLATWLDSEQVSEALASALQLEHDMWRVETIRALCPVMDEDSLRTLIRDLVCPTESERGWWRPRVLSFALPHLARLGHWREAIAYARDLKGSRDRAFALAGIAAHAPLPEREGLVDEAWQIPRSSADEETCTLLLDAICPVLDEGLLRRILGEVSAFTDAFWHASALLKIVQGVQSDLLEGTISALISLQPKAWYADVATALAVKLAAAGAHSAALHVWETLEPTQAAIALGQISAGALSASVPSIRVAAHRLLPSVLRVDDSQHRAQALSALLGVFGDRDRSAAWDAFEAALERVRSAPRRAELLAAAVARLPDATDACLVKVLACATGIGEDAGRAVALTAIAGLAATRPDAVRPHWDTAILALSQRSRRAFLGDLVPLALAIYSLGGHAAVAETFDAVVDVGCWWP